MNELKVFRNPDFGTVRTVGINGEPWLVGKDVALALGYKNPQEAIRTHVDDEDKGVREILTPGGKQKVPVINESGLFSLVLSSKLPGAKKFRRWVTSEVLPAIRKTGQYSAKAAPDPHKAALAEAKLNNSRARAASVWLKLAQYMPSPESKQICAHYASAELTGGNPVLPLPAVAERTYTAKEVGEMLGGISANKVGRIANAHQLKTPEYGIEVWDKSPHSAKQIPTWRYNQKAVDRLRSILGEVNAV